MSVRKAERGYILPSEFVDSIRRMIRYEFPTKADWFTLAVIANVDYRQISNFMEYYPQEYKDLCKLNKWKFCRYPSMLMCQRILEAFNCDIEIRVIKKVQE